MKPSRFGQAAFRAKNDTVFSTTSTTDKPCWVTVAYRDKMRQPAASTTHGRSNSLCRVSRRPRRRVQRLPRGRRRAGRRPKSPSPGLAWGLRWPWRPESLRRRQSCEASDTSLGSKAWSKDVESRNTTTRRLEYREPAPGADQGLGLRWAGAWQDAEADQAVLLLPEGSTSHASLTLLEPEMS